ncbi:hypothetical protein BDL97_06G130900 [Sphagnum fallax]|nr:hypothetical protein BDL97_06G130900 [Sphagnum fallax]
MSSRIIESSIEESSATASDSKESSNWGKTTPLSLPPYKWWERIRLQVEALFKAFTLLDKQHQLKQIAASQHALKTYHDSFLFGKVPLSVKLRALLRTSTVSFVWHIMEASLAILSGAVYIYTTYHFHEEYEWVTLTQDTVSCLFLMDYVLRVYSEPVRLQYMFSYIGVLDFLSATPIIFLYQHKNPVGGAAVLHLLQFSRFIRILTFPTSVGIVASTVIEQILLLVVSCFGAVFLDAGIVQWIEYAAASEQIQQNCPTSGCLNFMDAFYYVVATISTVGYGDVTTKTNAGKIVCIVTIMCALVFIPYQVARITRLASSRPYGGTFNTRKIIGNRYLIISGSVSFQAVQICLAEFYNPTHCDDIKAYPLHVNILAPFIPSFEFKKMLSLYNGHVEFMEGSPVHQSDLERVCASHAAAIFLLANKQTNDTKVEDAAQIVRALAVNRHCGNKVAAFVYRTFNAILFALDVTVLHKDKDHHVQKFMRAMATM